MATAMAGGATEAALEARFFLFLFLMAMADDGFEFEDRLGAGGRGLYWAGEADLGSEGRPRVEIGMRSFFGK